MRSFKLLASLSAILAAVPARAQVRSIMEGISASNNTILVSTVTRKVIVGTNTAPGSVPNLSLYVKNTAAADALVSLTSGTFGAGVTATSFTATAVPGFVGDISGATGLPTTSLGSGPLPVGVTVSTANIVPGFNGANNLAKMDSSGNFTATYGVSAATGSFSNSASTQAVFYGHSGLGGRTNNDSGAIQLGSPGSANGGLIDYNATGSGTFSLRQTYAPGKIVLDGGDANGASVWPVTIDKTGITSTYGISGTTGNFTSSVTISGASAAPILSLRRGILNITDPPNSNIDLEFGGYPTPPYAMWAQSFNVGGVAYPLVLNPLGGNVGIGMSAPGYKLHMSSGVFWNDGNALGPQIENVNSANEALIEQDALAANQSARYVAYNDQAAGLEMLSYGTQKTGTVFGLTRATFSVITNGSAAPLAIGNSGAQPIIFATNNVEKMRLTSAGNLGVGTTAPSTELEVKGGSVAFSRNGGSGSAVQGIDFTYDATSNGISGYPGTGANKDFFITAGASADGNAALIFNSVTSSVVVRTNSQDRVTVTQAGSVGIGTTTPAYLLDVVGPTSSAPNENMAMYRQSGAVNDLLGQRYDLRDSNSARATYAVQYGYLISNTAGAQSGGFQWHTANGGTVAERMRMLNTGNLGIGNTNPATKLHMSSGVVTLDGTAGGKIVLGAPSSDGLIWGSVGDGVEISADTQQQGVYLGDRSTKYDTLKVIGGKVGINMGQTNNPATALHLSSGSITLDGGPSNPRITLGGGGLATNGEIQGGSGADLVIGAPGGDIFMGGPGGVFNAVDIGNAPANTLVVGGITSGSSIARIGVGTASPATTLDVNGNAQFGSGATKSTFTTIGSLTLDPGALFTASTITINTTGLTTSGGKVGIGVASPSATLQVRPNTDDNLWVRQFNDVIGGFGSLGIVLDSLNNANTLVEGFGIRGTTVATYTDAGLALTLLSNRNFGIGTAAPGTLLDVNGASTIRGQETVTSTTTIQGQDASGYSLKLSSSITIGGCIQFPGSLGIQCAPATVGAGTGDAVKSATQTWSGSNTHTSTEAFTGAVYGVEESTAVYYLPMSSGTQTAFSGCDVAGSSATLVTHNIGAAVSADFIAAGKMTTSNLLEITILMDGKTSDSSGQQVNNDGYFTAGITGSDSTIEASAYFVNVTSGTHTLCVGVMTNTTNTWTVERGGVLRVRGVRY